MSNDTKEFKEAFSRYQLVGAARILADKLEAVEVEVLRLRAALEKYRHCRHACVDCFCTKEARNALGRGGA